MKCKSNQDVKKGCTQTTATVLLTPVIPKTWKSKMQNC